MIIIIFCLNLDLYIINSIREKSACSNTILKLLFFFIFKSEIAAINGDNYLSKNFWRSISIDDNTPVYSPRFFVCGMIARFRYAE